MGVIGDVGSGCSVCFALNWLFAQNCERHPEKVLSGVATAGFTKKREAKASSPAQVIRFGTSGSIGGSSAKM